jgi:hypothetical protein
MQKAVNLSRSSEPTARARPARDFLAPRGFGERRGTEDIGFARPLSSSNPVIGELSSAPIGVQAMLTINQPRDAYEQEADRVADQVMRMTEADIAVSRAPAQVSRKCAACEEEDKEKLQMKSAGSPAHAGGGVPGVVFDVLQSPGQPLDFGSRAFFEPRFGRNISGVRVHTDTKAGESARLVNAPAYTVGQHIAFGTGQYAPEAVGGRRLIAHELAHTIQQDQSVASAHNLSQPLSGVLQRQDDQIQDAGLPPGGAPATDQTPASSDQAQAPQTMQSSGAAASSDVTPTTSAPQQTCRQPDPPVISPECQKARDNVFIRCYDGPQEDISNFDGTCAYRQYVCECYDKDPRTPKFKLFDPQTWTWSGLWGEPKIVGGYKGWAIVLDSHLDPDGFQFVNRKFR